MVDPSRPRRERRESMDALIVCQDWSDGGHSARIFDLSRNGCRIANEQPLSIHRHLWITLPGLKARLATVCWLEDGVAGIEFERPLHPLIFLRVVDELREL